MLLMNKRIDNDFEIIKREFSAFPKDAKYVLESSSVWYGVHRMLTAELGRDVVLSSPYLTRLITASKKKTDRFDAHALADMLRGDSSMSAMSRPQARWRKSRRYASAQGWSRPGPG